MLDRLLRGLVGRKPAESERRSASGTAGPALLPLAQRVVDHYRNTPPPRGADVEAEARAFTEELLQDADPADLVASLIISHAAITVALRAEGPGSAHVGNGYRSIMSHGLARLVQIPVQNWGLSDRQIRAVLDFYAHVMLVDPHWGLESSVFLAGIMKRAASGGPAQRAALVAFIDRALQTQQLGATQVRIFIEENLPALGIAREEIPILARWAAKSREIQLLRDRTIAGAGRFLGPALEHLLDGGMDLFCGRADQCEALQKLFGADAPARGAAFSYLLDRIVTCAAQEVRYDNLQAIARFRGYFSHELAPDARTAAPLDMLAIELSKGKMNLADPDRDHARLIFLLTCRDNHWRGNSRLILKQLLKTAQAHPGGLTAHALKKLIEHPGYSVWAADVREVLHDGVYNSGSEGVASLPPIELPDFSAGNFVTQEQTLEEHFGNLLEPRLYDRVHSDFLERVAMLAYAIEALPAGDGRGQEIRRLIAASGLPLEPAYGAGFVDRGRMLHELRGAFRPLVVSEPDAVEKLTSLAHQIDNRSAPAAKWMHDARAVRDMLPEETWLDHLRRITQAGSPYAGFFGVPGEACLRSMIYVAATLRPRMSARCSPTMRSSNAM